MSKEAHRVSESSSWHDVLDTKLIKTISRALEALCTSQTQGQMRST